MEIPSLEQYVQKYHEKVTAENAGQVIAEFDENWKHFTKYMDDETSKGLSEYGLALIILSVGYYELKDINERDIIRLSELIGDFDLDDNVKSLVSTKNLYIGL